MKIAGNDNSSDAELNCLNQLSKLSAEISERKSFNRREALYLILVEFGNVFIF